MISITKPVQDFMQVFRDNSYQIYLVGGGVRDLLLGKETKNWDFTTNANPEQIIALFPDSFYNNSFGTVGIPLEVDNEKLIFEVTPFRKESSYTDNRHPDCVEWTDDVKEDLARRDFTINAIAFDGKELVDIYNGQEDIKTGTIKAVGNPDIRFQEDALRLMRAIRFAAALGFSIEKNTLDSISKNASLIQKISWERIREEFLKIISGEKCDEGVMLLKNTGILHFILPELDRCFTIDQKSPNRHHTDDAGTHLVKSLKYCPSQNPITRFATLIHDIGKFDTFKKDETTGQVTFYNHEVVSRQQAVGIAARFKLSKADTDKLVRLVEFHQFTVNEELTDNAIRRFIRNVGLENIQDMLDLRTGDRLGSGANESSWRLELFKKRLLEVQHEPFSVKDLKVDGHDVMEIFQIKPSKQIGDVLDALFAEVEEKKVPNERKALLNRLKEMKQS
jgi:tRNA nucleotidyltransferase/poly(A) polymerase